VAKAKSDETAASSAQRRRDKLASLEAARKKEQRGRTIKLFVICLVLAIALLAYPVYLFVDDYRARNATIDDLGSSIAAASCDPVAVHAATGNQDHVAEGTKVDYAETPPDSGKHYPTPAPFTKHFYAEADRPPVETLVHNLEHGYTVVWYRADAPSAPPTPTAKTTATACSLRRRSHQPIRRLRASPIARRKPSYPCASARPPR